MAPFTISRHEDQLHLRRRLVLGLARLAQWFCLAALVPAFFIWMLPILWPFGPGPHAHWSTWPFLLGPFVVVLPPLFDLTPLGRLGEHVIFDRGCGRMFRNGRRLARLRDIRAVQVVRTGYRNPKTCVMLLLKDSPPLTLSTDYATLVWFGDGRALACAVAKFVGVPLVDNGQ